jgi:hypothetical protein
MPHVDHGFDLPAVRTELDSSDWEEDCDNPGTEIRRVWLGTVFGLTPSGKLYQPFACGNLDVCAHCKGTGSRPPHRRRRIAKRWVGRGLRIRRTFERRLLLNDEAARRWLSRHQAWRLVSGPTCVACGGLGSREAYLDELWNTEAEKAMESIGAYFSWEDGDGFAVETRPAEGATENDTEGVTAHEGLD